MGSRPSTTSGAADPVAYCFDVADWVAASCESQGVPVKVTDARIVAKVAVLFGAPVAGSEPPDRLHPGGVEDVATGTAGDHGVVEDRGDDGVAAVETEIVPVVS